MKLFILLTLLCTTHTSLATEWVNEVPNTSITIPKMIRDHRNWFARLDAVTSPMPGNLLGGGVVIGRQFEFLTADLSAKFIMGSYGAIAPERGLDTLDDASSYPVASDPSAEINNRNRPLTTPFSGILFGPAAGVHSKLLQKFSPRLTEMARVGFHYGTLTDGTNATVFTTLLVFAEASIHYQLTETGAWTVAGTVSANSGRMMNDQAPSGTQGRVPVLFGNIGLSLAHWF